MKRSQIIFFLLLTLLFGNKLFAQEETSEKSESESAEILLKVSGDEEICEFNGCRKRKEILEGIEKIKQGIVRDKKPGIETDDLEYFRFILEIIQTRS
jgi:hypothetical protein